MFKKLVSHSLIYGIALQMPKLAALLALPFTTVYLTEVDFGVFGVITAATGPKARWSQKIGGEQYQSAYAYIAFLTTGSNL